MIYIIVLNWRNSSRTIDCLRSAQDILEEHRIVVCDNGSMDDSVYRLVEFLNESDIVKSRGGWGLVREDDVRVVLGGYVTLLVNSENYGYAGGNNSAIRKILVADANASAFWIVNNDAVVGASSLTELLRVNSKYGGGRILGSVLLDGAEDGAVQMAGGNLWKLLGVPKKNHKGRQADDLDAEIVCDYVSGASIFLDRTLLDQIGLMDERYFLYWEETDWCFRAKRLTGEHPICCTKSRVTHFEGATVGFRSELQRRLDAVNMIRFYKRFLPWYLPVVFFIKPLINIASDIRRKRLERMSGPLDFLLQARGLFLGTSQSSRVTLSR